MLLKDILPGCPGPFSSNPEVARFEFGTRYTALLVTGARVDFSDFEDAMRTLADALATCPTTDVELRIEADVLVLRLEVQLGRPWGRDTAALLERVRFAVGHHMMTDQWPDDIPQKMRTSRWT